jgi:peptide-methionine (S)-S-oxide reductase
VAIETITLGGGCFWCLEAVYQEMEGVVGVESGYMGGHTADPTYRDVCGGATGHAEVVRVRFDAEVTGVADVLEVFFAIHDPTTLNRQGNDVGTQYRSAVFHHSEAQREAALEAIRGLDFPRPVVTEVVPATTFYKAEDYHQNYFRDNASQPYCAYVVSPKVAKFRQKFAMMRRG